jgi:3-hydroxyisobutyrate dehydrogenase-like beta-hydroxyacid dehydrogenase
MNETRSRIAVLGIGPMGSPQARNILKEGFALTAWKRAAATNASC